MDVTLRAAQGRFADPAVTRQGWYCLARASRVGRKPRVVHVAHRRLVVYRDAAGAVHATDDRCPHLGADLALAKVTDAGLVCGFHGWCWGEDGRCAAAPGNAPLPSRRLRHYPLVERHGFLWAWAGPGEPGIPFPEAPPELRHRFVLRAQRVGGHPDVVFSNSFDHHHFGPSHGLEARTVAVKVDPPWRMTHHVEGVIPARPQFRAVGIAGKPWEAVITQHAGGIVHIRFHKPTEHLVAFAMRREPDGKNRTRTMLFLKRRRDLPGVLAFLWTIVLDDLRLMETMRWSGAFAEGDDLLRQYARYAEGMPTW